MHSGGGGGGPVRKDTFPIKIKINPREENRLDHGPNSPPWRTTVLNLEFKPRPLVISAYVGVGSEFVHE